MSPRFYSGNESWVFAAPSLEHLCGHHAGLATAALGTRERPAFMVYAPRRDAVGAPFGVRTDSGSHALVVTETRAIVTHDPHRPDRVPSVREAAWADVMAVELGESLTLGWCSLVVRRQGHPAKLSIPFAASGIEHFRAAVRWWRQRSGRIDATASGHSGDDPLAEAPAYFRNAVAGVLAPGEYLVEVVTGSQVQGPTVNGPPACPSALCAMSASGLVLAESELPCHRAAVAFGVNLICIDWGAVQDVRAGRIVTGEATIGTLAVTVRSADATHRYELPLGGIAPATIDALASAARRLAAGDARMAPMRCP